MFNLAYRSFISNHPRPAWLLWFYWWSTTLHETETWDYFGI